jgi:chromosome segregation ATPase
MRRFPLSRPQRPAKRDNEYEDADDASTPAAQRGDGADPRTALADEQSEFDRKVSTLKKEILNLDEEYELMRVRHQTQLETLSKRRDTLNRHIELLQSTDVAAPGNGRESIDIRETRARIESQLTDVSSNSKALEAALSQIQKETVDLAQLIDAVPSDNPEIIEIARRQMARKVQSELCEFQLQVNDLSEAVADHEDELQLSNTISSGLAKENRETADRIQKLRTQCEAANRERAALLQAAQESSGQMPLSDLSQKLQEIRASTQSGVREIETNFKSKFETIDSETNHFTSELEETRNAIELLNGKIQELTGMALEVVQSKNREIEKLKRRHRAELEDIQRRFQSQLKQQLAEQKRRFIEVDIRAAPG